MGIIGSHVDLTSTLKTSSEADPEAKHSGWEGDLAIAVRGRHKFNVQ
jgi:hypothetical protein